MEHVNTPADLPTALLRAKTRGHIDRSQMQTLSRELSEALESVASYGWFEPGLKVIKERGMIVKGRLLRPDRVVVRQDGSAAVVDYKFGERRNDKAYMRQTRRYADSIVQAGIAKKCEAYIWYVSLGKVISNS